MKTILKILPLLIALLVMPACEDVVQIKLDEGSKLYVIDAFINDKPSRQTVRVLLNDTYFSNSEAPPVGNAKVVLNDLNEKKTYSFVYNGNGNYIFTPDSNAPMAINGHQYELEVTIEGQSYRSLSTQNRTAIIDSIVPELFEGGGGFGPPQAPFYFCTLYARDKVDPNTDYYWVKTYRNDSLLFGPSDINVSIDGTNGPVPDAGQEYLSFTPPITFLGFNRYNSGNTCKVEIHSISRDAYFFFIQAAAQVNNGGLFATTPENVKTNILTPPGAGTKAVGWFNMATVSSMKIVIP